MRIIIIFLLFGVAVAEDTLPDLARVDTDGDGFISVKEWNGFYQRADQNGDGVVEAEEFHAAARGIKLYGDGPAVGELGPSIRVLSHTTGRSVDLFKLPRPSVLLFGAWT